MRQLVKNILRQLPGAKESKKLIGIAREKWELMLMEDPTNIKQHQIIVDPANPLHHNYREELDYFYRQSSKFNRIIIWGFKAHFHTHRFIHKHFYENLVKLGANTLWLEDAETNVERIEKNDLVFAMNQAYTHLPLRPDVYYCLHNIDLPKDHQLKVVNLQVYSNQIQTKTEQWNAGTFFSKESKMLYQAWGTDLLPHEFYPPVYNKQAGDVFWIGSIWNNALNQGNEPEIEELKKALQKNNLVFKQREKVSVKKNIQLVRASRLAPAISGRFQVEVDYMPCRVFKNISYGCLAITNVKKFEELFGPNIVRSNNISTLIDQVMNLSEKEWLSMTLEQQKEVAKENTYLHKFNRVFKAFEQLY